MLPYAINPLDIYSDSRTHGYQGPSRYVRYPRVVSPGGGCIARSGDGIRCAVAGKESLRILRISDSSLPASPEFRSSLGKGGHRIEATRNLWEGNGLKIESAATGIAWGRGPFSNKIFTSARNGELIMWDISRAGSAKLERRIKDHTRSINQLAISHSVHHYCVTGSADGDMRIWDLRDMSKSLMRVHHPASVRSVVFSPILWQPLQAIVGLDNGSIYRWDLKMGQRGLLDRLLVAHTTPVTSLSWRDSPRMINSETIDNGMGWFASGGLDCCVKVWDLTAPGSSSRIPAKPTYTLHPRYPVRHILWRPGHDCEIAVISNPELAIPATKTEVSKISTTPPFLSRSTSSNTLDLLSSSTETEPQQVPASPMDNKAPAFRPADDAIEIWDVRRGWIAKWSVRGSGAEGSLTGVDFADSHAIWALQASGTFSQFDLRDASKPSASVPRVALTWEVSGSFTFVSDRKCRNEIPYDDIRPEIKPLAEKLRMHIKTLGDPQTQPQMQNIVVQSLPHVAIDLESFKHLAKKYILTGENRMSICIHNAQVAAEAGKQETAQLWLLLAACLEEVVPPSPPILAQVTSNAQELFTHALATPASARYAQSYFSLTGGRALEGSQSQKTSPGHGSVGSAENSKYVLNRNSSRSVSRHLTPASSASSSPHHGLVHLPPITPRRPSFLGQRATADHPSSGRHPSAYRRPSIVASILHASTSLAVDKDGKTPSTSSHRLVGEGALDDSDSSSGNDSDIGSAGTAGNWSDDEANLRPPLMSPTLFSQQRTAPSPLSRVAGRHRWTDEDGDVNDDEVTSASPQSTDSDVDDGPIASLRRPSSTGRKMSGRYKSRSRSSTVASLAAATAESMLTRQDSVSSIRTVVAGDVTYGDGDGLSLKPEETMHDLNSRVVETTGAIAMEIVQPDVVPNPEYFTERRIELVQADEKRLKDIGWKAVRQAVETLAEQGDVQTCGMLVIIGRSELHIGVKRSTAMVDAYLDMLDRLRMFSCSAYIRKHCQLSEIQDTTMIHTIIPTSCVKCFRPLLKSTKQYLMCHMPAACAHTSFSMSHVQTWVA
ncbi:hypothetical protein APHAL10511_003481 [Amanita phalloides]|nr:hypothetical protein APHAL10511_003481 [Amanita phalloides]